MYSHVVVGEAIFVRHLSNRNNLKLTDNVRMCFSNVVEQVEQAESARTSYVSVVYIRPQVELERQPSQTRYMHWDLLIVRPWPRLPRPGAWTINFPALARSIRTRTVGGSVVQFVITFSDPLRHFASQCSFDFASIEYVNFHRQHAIQTRNECRAVLFASIFRQVFTRGTS